jgi:hypothetical protein
VFIRADALEGQSGPYLTWGYAPFLMPGESVTVEVEGEGGVEVSALNAAPVVVKF